MNGKDKFETEFDKFRYTTTMESMETLIEEYHQLSQDYLTSIQEIENMKHAIFKLKTELQEPGSLPDILNVFQMRFYFIEKLNEILNGPRNYEET